MSLLEKFNESKKTMYAKFDEAREICEKAIDAAGNEFLDDFKSLVISASEEEFMEFLFKSGDDVDEIEKIAAITARVEAHRNKTEAEKVNNKPKDSKGHPVVIIGLG